MKNVIVPVDFSETSLNAARYAMKLLTGHYGVTMILYHHCGKPEQIAEAEQHLELLKKDLNNLGIVKTSSLASNGSDFITSLEQMARINQADLVIMGITGRSAIGQTLIGSNTLKMIRQKICPVMIIPPECSFTDIKSVLLTSDFKKVTEKTPSVPVKKVLKPFHPELHIMNVDTEHYVALTEEYKLEQDKLKKMFDEYNPEFHFLGLPDVSEAINQFAIDLKTDLIIIVHKEQNLLSKLFVKSHTKKLVYESRIPVLAVHELSPTA